MPKGTFTLFFKDKTVESRLSESLQIMMDLDAGGPKT
jgi:hypothetical protein